MWSKSGTSGRKLTTPLVHIDTYVLKQWRHLLLFAAFKLFSSFNQFAVVYRGLVLNKCFFFSFFLLVFKLWSKLFILTFQKPFFLRKRRTRGQFTMSAVFVQYHEVMYKCIQMLESGSLANCLQLTTCFLNNYTDCSGCISIL